MGNRAVLAVALLTSTTLSPLAAQVASQRPDPRAAWTRFVAEHGRVGGAWKVEWSPASGTPRAIWGPGLKLKDGRITTLDEARRFSNATLRRFAALLGQGDSTFVEIIGHKVSRLHVFVYDQYYRGLQVIGGRADVRVHEVGAVSMFGSEAFAIPAGFDTRPKIDVTEARARAWLALDLVAGKGPAELRKPTDRPVIWADWNRDTPSPVRLAWEIDVDVPDRKKIGRAYIDATTGRLLQYRNELHECNFGCSHDHDVHAPECDTDCAHDAPAVEAPRVEVAPRAEGDAGFGPNAAVNVIGDVKMWANVGLDPVGALSNVAAKGIRVQIVGGNSGLTDAAGKFNIPHPSATPVQVRVTFSQGRRIGNVIPRQGSPMTVTATLTPGTASTIQVYTSSAVQFDRSQSTAFWFTERVNEWTRVLIGNPSQMATIDRITATVNVTSSCNATYSRNNMNFYHDTSGCPNTAYSTVVQHEWGHGLDDIFGGISQIDGLSEGYADVLAILETDQPIVGPKFFKTRTPNYVRTANNTLTYPAGGGPHQQGQTWMGCAWDFRMGLIPRLGRAAALAVASKDFVGSIVANPRNQPTALREAFLVDDDDANLNNGTPHCRELLAAATKRKIPAPVSKCSPFPAEYDVFGVGCRGSGPTNMNCNNANTTCTNADPSGSPNFFAIQCTAGSGADIVSGIDLYTRSRAAGSTTMRVAIHLATSAGVPNLAPLAATTMTVGTAARIYTATFASPVGIPQGQRYFIVFDTPTTSFPWCRTSGSKLTPYYLRGPSQQSWNGPSTGPWIFKVNCTGGPGAIPIMTAQGIPDIGRSMKLDLQQAAKSTPGALLFGASKSQWGTIRLPFDFTPLGAPGCKLLVSGEISVPVRTDANGMLSYTLGLPNDRSLLTQLFHNQYVILDQQANALKLVVGNGGTGKVGLP